jgi:hypothetical protein
MKVELRRICGVDLTSIDGINVMTAFTVISEIGTDMSRFHDEGHLTSWMGLTPSKDISSGKIVGRGKKKVKNRTAATSLLESDTTWEPAIAICAGSCPASRLRSKRWPAILRCYDLPLVDSWRSVGGSRGGAI